LLRCRRDRADVVIEYDDFRYWPLASFTALQKCGRYRINSGQTAPSDLTASAAFDPTATLAVHRGNGLMPGSAPIKVLA
jgi:hypothetical protein